MKYLENQKLEALSSLVSERALDCQLDLRIEPYSCKMVQSDKKLWKKAGAVQERQPLSPPVESWMSISPLSVRVRHLSEPCGSTSDNDADVLLDSISTKTLFNLIGVLNTSYSDYDFSGMRSNRFSLVPSFEAVQSSVDMKFGSTVENFSDIRSLFWLTIDDEIKANQCTIYTYLPAGDDPFTEGGCIDGFNYFFYNKALKRILFLSCRSLSKNSDYNATGDEENMWTMEED